MKLTNFGTFIIYIYLLLKTKLSFGKTADRHTRNVHDVLDIVQNAMKVIETAHSLGLNNDFWLNRDVHDKLFQSKLLNLIPVFIKISKNARIKRCLQDLWYLKENLHFRDFEDSWAWKMIDSFGKPESGFLEGNLKWVGNFDECRNAYAPKKKGSDAGGYHGHYCNLKLTLMDTLPMRIGICLPETCNPSDFEPILNISNLIPPFYKPDIKLKIESLTCKGPRIISKVGIITISIISVFILLAILGSTVTAYKNYNNAKPKEDLRRYEGDLKSVAVNFDSEKLTYGIPKVLFVFNDEIPSTILGPERVFSRQDSFKIRRNAETVVVKPLYYCIGRKFEGLISKCDAFLNCFCVFTNGSKLLNANVEDGQLSCIHGIRFLSITWVILGHLYLSILLTARTYKDILPRIDNLFFQVVLNAWYSVDSFFVLSGFLMSYLYFQERTKRRSEIAWINFYFHRFLRLTPIYVIVLAFFATVLPLLGSGPFWYWFDFKVEEHCQNTWWRNLLYISNFQDLLDQCMPWSWYLANEMQFFILSPIFLITLWRWPKTGYSVLVLFLCCSWISGFVITYYYGLTAGSISNPKDIAKDPAGYVYNWKTFMDKIYIKPYIRIAPYIIGIGLGHIMFKRRNASFKINRIYLWLGWLIAVLVALFCVYGLYGQTLGIVGASFYNALSRTAWALSVAWVIFACLSGRGGVVDKILSCRIFIPLSRITFCAYLIHPLFIGSYMFTLRTPLAFSHPTMVLLFLGLIMLIFTSSILVSLIFESPVIRMEKMLNNKLQSRYKCS
ncbi:nose resistant to fluoxetine protein 6 [Parasteatoda tepidariorum]|uniref:nose resistant to fluoxetine protein 6 n=1 Tax=Parasteatoda tepidariorum TaxID=114398 RepID=UPI001C717F51|nr:nose resistant to fluoxetine protein 6 [Parasteatoda tepidariorum]